MCTWSKKNEYSKQTFFTGSFMVSQATRHLSWKAQEESTKLVRWPGLGSRKWTQVRKEKQSLRRSTFPTLIARGWSNAGTTAARPQSASQNRSGASPGKSTLRNPQTRFPSKPCWAGARFVKDQFFCFFCQPCHFPSLYFCGLNSPKFYISVTKSMLLNVISGYKCLSYFWYIFKPIFYYLINRHIII